MWPLKLPLMRLRKSVCDTMNLQDDNSFSPLSVCLNMRLLPSVVTLYIINRSGTLIKGCEGYNHLHTCKWGNFLCFIFCHLIVYSFFLFSEVEINLTFRERENFRTESIFWISWIWRKHLPLFYLQVTGKITALKGLDARLREIRSYLDLVIDEKLPLNHEILYHLQVHFLSWLICRLPLLL